MTTLLFGRWNPDWLTWARSCHAAEIEVDFLEIGRKPADKSRYSSCLTSVAAFDRSLVFKPVGIEAIRERIKTVGAACMVANRDEHIEWLAANRAAFEPACQLVASSLSTLQTLKSKAEQLELARRAGFSVLPSWFVCNQVHVEDIPKREFPVAIRPSDPADVAPTFKVKVIDNADGLRQFIGGRTRIKSPIVAQPFLPGPNLLVHGVRSPDGAFLELAAFKAARKFRDVALTIERCELAPEVEDACRRFADISGLAGPFHFELLWPEGREPFFLEVNPRFGGTSGRIRVLGFDEPRLCLSAFGLIAQQNEPKCRSRRRAVEKVAILRHAYHAAGGRIRETDYPPAPRLVHVGVDLVSLIRDRDSVFDWSDLQGSLWYTTGRVGRVIRAWIRRKWN